MDQVALAPYRVPTGFMPATLDLKYKIIETTSAIESDLWNLLEYHSEVESVGVKLVESRLPGVNDKLDIYHMFRSFIRQGKSYYSSARSLHYRSSSLLYYYSFLNLAKALLVLKEPSSVRGRVSHGLSYDTESKNRDFRQEFVQGRSKGVWPMLFEEENHLPLSGIDANKYRITELLSYCTSIGLQYQMAHFGSQGYIPSRCALLLNTPRREAWLLIEVLASRSVPPIPLAVEQELQREFEETSVLRPIAKQIFDSDGKTAANSRYFQHKVPIGFLSDDTVNLAVLIGSLRNALGRFADISYVPSHHDFCILVPCGSHNIPVNELLAIYAIMFYLSSLVRYRPYYLEELLEQESAWIIESFVSSMPEIFLRAIVNRIADDGIALRRI